MQSLKVARHDQQDARRAATAGLADLVPRPVGLEKLAARLDGLARIQLHARIMGPIRRLARARLSSPAGGGGGPRSGGGGGRRRRA